MGGATEDKKAIDELFSAIYHELRHLAQAVSRSSANTILSPTALVNEAYLKMIGSGELAALPELHFKRIAARAMKQVLVDAARRRLATKRGGDRRVTVTLDSQVASYQVSIENITIVKDFLDKLAEISPRQAAVVEYRFFGGLVNSEIAELLEISEVTVERDWRAARAWLAVELQGATP